MMQQSNTLRNLEQILSEAVDTVDKTKSAGHILLEKMKLKIEIGNIIYFYELLNNAKKDAKSIRNKGDLSRDIKVIDQLHTLFLGNVLWSTQWNVFESHIKAGNILSILNALANYYYDQKQRILLDEDVLVMIENKFQSLLNDIKDASLSTELKNLLIINVENIIVAIQKYSVNGTEGLEAVSKLLLSDLLIVENHLKNEDKINPAYNAVRTWGLSLILWITPPPYNSEFWKPTFDQLSTNVLQVQEILNESSTSIQEAYQKASCIFSEPQKMISGASDRKSLPPSK